MGSVLFDIRCYSMRRRNSMPIGHCKEIHACCDGWNRQALVKVMRLVRNFNC